MVLHTRFTWRAVTCLLEFLYPPSRLCISSTRRFLQSADVTTSRKTVNIEANLNKAIIDTLKKKPQQLCAVTDRGKSGYKLKGVVYKSQAIIILFF